MNYVINYDKKSVADMNYVINYDKNMWLLKQFNFAIYYH